MSVDFRELEAFRDKIQHLGEQKASLLCDECAKELTGRLLAKVIKRTPVGQRPDEFNGKDGVKKRKETQEVTGKDGTKSKMLTADAARYQQYWSGYVGGTLRRGCTGGQNVNAKQYAQSMPVNVMNNNHVIDIINQVEYALIIWGM